MNKYTEEGEKSEIPLLYIDESAGEEQQERLADLRARRADPAPLLQNIRSAASGTANLMPPIIEAAKGGVTLGEIVQAMKDVFGEYREPAEF